MTSDRVGAASPESALFAAMLRTALLPGAACGAVAVALFWVARGLSGGLAAAGGVVVALVFFGAGLLVMKRLATDNPMTLVTGALAVFLGQVIFLGVIILTLSSADWLDGVAFGAAVLVVAIAWQGREKLHYLNPVPLQQVYDRWIEKYERHRLRALRDLRQGLEATAFAQN